MKLAIVVQRYGTAINGGAELHARYIAEHLARHVEVDVLTTCAADYVTWRNELRPGLEQVNRVAVRRFQVRHERDPLKFGRLSERVFHQVHSIAEELDWLDAEGPASPALIDYLIKHASEYDYCLFFSYRYYHAFHGARAVSSRAILVPTAERDYAIGLSIFRPVFRSVRALMYNSPEERSLIQAVADNQDIPSVVVGIGSEVPPSPQPAKFRQKFNLREPFAVYVGRIDANKGCQELFDFFDAYLRAQAGKLSLVLVGHSLLPIPTHPRIRHLGFLDDTDKFNAMAAAEVLIMPSYFESLSMVTLEAWAMGRPVLANARCDVLKGQCIRSNAGLYYDGRDEFIETLRAIEQNRWLAGSLGRSGREFYRTEYDWPVIEHKYLDLIGRLAAEPPARYLDPLPGWFDRRKVDCPPAATVVAALPAGPSVSTDMLRSRAAMVTPPLPRRADPERPSPPRNTPADRGRSSDPRRGGQRSRRPSGSLQAGGRR